jgi:hypothetical protein
VKISKPTFLLASGALAVALAAPAIAAQRYDGDWRVNVKSRSGGTSCMATTVSLRVEEGNVKYAGLFSGLVSGRVDDRGRLHASMAKVRVSGRLNEATGSGAWKSPNCAGTWNATRQ